MGSHFSVILSSILLKVSDFLNIKSPEMRFFCQNDYVQSIKDRGCPFWRYNGCYPGYKGIKAAQQAVTIQGEDTRDLMKTIVFRHDPDVNGNPDRILTISNLDERVGDKCGLKVHICHQLFRLDSKSLVFYPC